MILTLLYTYLRRSIYVIADIGTSMNLEVHSEISVAGLSYREWEDATRFVFDCFGFQKERVTQKRERVTIWASRYLFIFLLSPLVDSLVKKYILNLLLLLRKSLPSHHNQEDSLLLCCCSCRSLLCSFFPSFPCQPWLTQVKGFRPLLFVISCENTWLFFLPFYSLLFIVMPCLETSKECLPHSWGDRWM